MAAPAFTEHDVSKAIAGAVRQKMTPTRIDIDRKTGKISMFFGDSPAEPQSEDEIASWLDEHDNSQRARTPQGNRQR